MPVSTFILLVCLLVSCPFICECLAQQADSLALPPQEEDLLDYISNLNALQDSPADELQLILDDTSTDSTDQSADLNTTSAAYSYTVAQSIHRKLDLTRGFSTSANDGGYAGSPYAFFTRLDLRTLAGHSFRFAAEKDPGEALLWSPHSQRYGFDHISGGLTLKRFIFFNTLVLGDFTLNFGQGLLFSRSLSRGKGLEHTRRLLSPAQNHRSSASRSENSAFRGIAASIQLNPGVDWTFFLSSRYRDASVHTDSLRSIRSFVMSGLHRTQNELATRGTVREKLIGSNVSFTSSALILSLTGYSTRFNVPFAQSQERTQQFRFSGNTLAGASLYASYTTNRLLLSGELARSYPGQAAFLLGLHLAIPANNELLILLRSYGPAYHAHYASSFGSLKNEKGVYVAYTMHISPKIKWLSFVDHYTLPWISHTIAKPYTGAEFYTSIEYVPRTWLSTLIQYRSKHKSKQSIYSSSAFKQLKSTTPVHQSFGRFQIQFTHSAYFKARTRIDVKINRQNSTKKHGFMMYQDLILEPFHHFKIHTRFSIFDTDGNDTNVFTLEKDGRYRYSIQTLSGRGLRNFLFLKKEFGEGWTIEFKYSETRFAHRVARGSGNSTFEGKRLREVHLQIIRFVRGNKKRKSVA